MRIVTIARKPLEGNIPGQVIKTGTGALHIAASRIDGRWPTNLVFSHRPGCRVVGTKVVRGDRRPSDYSPRNPGLYNVNHVQSDGRPKGTLHGDQEIPVWVCVDTCPLQALGDVGRFFKRIDG